MGTLDRITKARIPLGSYDYGLGVTPNDLLYPFTDSRGDGQMLPEDFSLEEIGGLLGHVVEGLSPKEMATGIIDAINGVDETGRPLGLLERAFKLFPLGGGAGGLLGKVERAAVRDGIAAVSPDAPIPHGLAVGDVYPDTISAQKAWTAAGGKQSGLTVKKLPDGTYTHAPVPVPPAVAPNTGAVPAPSGWNRVVAPGGGAPPGGPLPPAPSVDRRGLPGRDPVGPRTPIAGLTDPEGRPLYQEAAIAGVRTPGGPDVPLSMPEEIALAKRLGDFRTPMGMAGANGGVVVKVPGTMDPPSPPQVRIEVDASKPDDVYMNAVRHEIGHAIDYWGERTQRGSNVGFRQYEIPDDVRGELERASAVMRPHLWAPDRDVIMQRSKAVLDEYRARPDELIADGKRFYQEDPAGFKAIAPNAAAYVRAQVNDDPLLSGIVQFNARAKPTGAVVGGLLGARAKNKAAKAGSSGVEQPPGLIGAPETPMSGGEVAPTRPPMGETADGGPPAVKGDIADPLPAGAPRADRPPVLHEGRDLTQWSPEDFEQFGKAHGVATLGPLSPPTIVRDLDGNAFEIPGGTEGTFTYYDLLHMKAQGINADRLAPADHVAIQKKMARTMTPERLSDAHVFNGLLFGITSPNQPLLPNQMAASLLKVSGPEDIDRLAGMIPWKVGDKVDKALRQQFDRRIAEHFGVQGGDRGGLGIKGSADYTRIAEMAQLFRERPEWFRLQPGEDWPDLVDRISSQVAGLGTKTASFSSVWQNPAGAQVSAMDRHMAQRFFDRMYPGKERRPIEAELAAKWNEHVERRRALDQQFKRGGITKPEYDRQSGNIAAGADATKVRNLQGILAQSGGDGFFTDQMLSRMGSGERKLWLQSGRGETATTVKNPALSPALQNTDWIREPDKVQTASPLYKTALRVNAEDAAQQDLSLFMSQWLGWDRQRRRFEPHENMFPGTELLPRPSQDQLRAALDAHRGTGHLDYTKVDQLNAKGELEQRLRPTRPTDNPASLAFFSQAVPIPGLIPVPAEQDDLGLVPVGIPAPSALGALPAGLVGSVRRNLKAKSAK